LTNAEARRPFDLAAGPLFRPLLLRLSAEEQVLLLALHHAVADGWSIGILLHELAVLYGVAAGGRPAPLPALPVQYVDFAVWQNAWLAGPGLDRSLDAWRERLAGAPAVLDLPTDRPRPVVRGNRGGLVPVTLDAGLTQDLRALGRRAGTPLFLTVLAGFQALLQRLSGQSDLVVGIPEAGRGRVEIENLIGFFVNALALRTDLAGDPVVDALLRRVRESALHAYAHAEVPFDRVVEALAPERRLDRSPLFQVSFTLDAATALPRLPDPAAPAAPADPTKALSMEALPLAIGSAKFDLTLALVEPAAEIAGMGGRLEYDRDLFDAATAERLVRHLAILLRGAVAEPGARLSALPLLSAAEQHQLLVTWNLPATGSTAFPRETPLHQLFAGQARQRPEATAVVDAGRHLSYGALAARSSALARRLRAAGVGLDVPVALCLERSPELILAILAVLQAGGAYLPLDPAYPRERLAFLLADSGAPVAVTTASLAAVLPAAGLLRRLLLEEDESTPEAPGAPDLPEVVATGDALAYILYTSGSTGQPKGVAVPHRGVVGRVIGTDYLRFAPGDRMAQAANPVFDIATLEIWGPLATGGTLVLLGPEIVARPAALAAALRAEAIDTLILATALVHQTARELPDAFAPLDTLIVGGEALDPGTVRRLLAAGPPRRLVNGYGPTESTAISTWFEIAGVPVGASTLPIGRPVAQTRVFVCDAALCPVPVGVAGQLYLGGDGLARGYWRQPERTAERFVPDPFAALQGGRPGGRLYATGDRVRWCADGVLEFLGRLDGQVKIRGFRIEPGEIEAVLAAHPAVEQAVVVARETPEILGGERRLVAYLVPAPGVAPGVSGVVAVADVAELRRFLAERLPAHLVPAHFVPLEAFPLTATGKVDRRALPDPDPHAAPADPAAGHVAPRTPLEEEVAAIWREVLGVSRVGIHDSFWELGGHSLLATRILARLEAALGVALPLQTLFLDPTLVGLTNALGERLLALAGEENGEENGQETGETPPAEPLPRLPQIPRAPRGEGVELPASFGQQRLWFLDRLQPGSAVYNLPVAWQLLGPWEPGLLAASLGEIVRRHEALRTTFVESPRGPLQRIAPAGPALGQVDLSGLPVSARRAAALRWVESEAQRPFDLARGPLLRLLLLRLSGEEQILFLALHHIVADGWSLDVLRRELRALYRASPLPELPVQYADFAIWQQGWLAGPLLAGQLAYWRDRLAGAPLALDLPTDRPHPPVEGFRGGAERVRLEAEVSRDLAALGRRRQAPLFMVLLAGWQALLGRYTGQEDLLVGVPTAGRSWVELEDLVGFFVNLLVLRTDLAGDPPFAALLGRVRDSALGAYEHADLPLERLVEELQPERSLRRSPLFQVVFTLQTAPVTLPPPLPGDLRLADLPLASGTAKFDLTLTLAESAAGLSGEIYYRRDLFDATTVQRMAGHLERLLSGIAQDPERRLSELPLLSAGEEAQALWEGSDAERWEPSGPALLVHERVAEQARRQPDAVAVAAGPARLTYGELAARAARLARHLRRRGVGPESRVAICAEGIERVIAMLGVLQAGGAFVPLDPAHPAERRAALVAAAGATVVLRDRDVADLAALPGDPPPAGRLVPESLAYVVFTSGSTGEPKGVAVPHAGLRNLVRWYEEDLALTPADHGTAVASPAFDAAVWEVWPLLAAGGCLHFADAEARLSPHRLARWWVEEGITVSFLPTPLAEPLLAAGFPPGTRHALRRLSVGGDRLRRRPHPDLGFPLVNAYGPSEYSVVATAGPVPLISPADSGLPAIGRAIDNTSLYIVDSHLNLLPPGMPGELCIAGAGLARGYLDRPDRTAERFLPDPWGALRGAPGARMYRSGDRVRRRTDGALDFLGRLDHQVKLRGMRVEPGEIEATLARHPAVREAVVLVREDRPGDRRLVAYVVPAPDTAPAIADLSADLSADLTRLLPALMVPQDWVFLPALPLTGNGKVDRKALPAPERVIAGTAESVAPRTPLEELLAGIFGAVLGQERVGIEDDFFALGGHSLLATQVVSRVRQALAVELPVRALFEAPTVGGLARRIAAERSAADTPDPSSRPPLVRIARRDGMPLPLSFAQQRLWFIDRLEPGSALYNIPLAYRVEGALAVAALGQALAEIVRRHEALRTTFVPGDATGGEPIQQIAPAAPAAPADASILSDPGRLCQVDLEALPEWLRSVELRRLAAAEAARPFDLARGPLLRATLIRLTAEEHALFLSLHHIVADGWSMGVLLQELAALYAAALADPGPRRAPLPELALQYADFALWQRGWLRGPVLEREVEHWRGRLAGVPAALDLPADRPRPAVQSYRGGALYRRLPSSLGKAVEATGRELGATPFMVLLAAFATLLSRASRQDDLAIGTPIAGRTHRELEDLIGFFVNTLVLRCDLSGAPSFARLVGRVREVALDGHAHQDLPFEKLVEALEPERTLSHSPLFQVMFVLQNAPHAAAFPDLRLIPEESVGSTAKFDLLLALRLGDEGLEAALEYGADRFDRATAARLFDHFERLLAAAVADPGRRVIALPLLSAAERAQLLVEWNDTAAPAVSAPGDRELLHDPFTAQALETPDRTALVFGAGHLSYAALDRRSNRLAHLLRRRGVGPEVVVGISVQRSFALIEGLLAILKAGGVLLPLDPSYPAERLGYMVADTRPALLVADTVSLSQLPELGEEVVVVDDLPLALGSSPAGGDPGAAPTPPPVGADLAYLIYTSGSTGQPKGIAMPHRAIASLVDWQRRRSPWEGARTLQFSPLSFDVCFQEMFSTWAVGGIVVLLSDPDRRDAAALLRTLERHEVERLDLPFVGLHNLVEMAAAWGAAPAALREVVTAGEALRVSELLAGWFARLPGCRLENHFGPSEAHVVTAHRLSGPPAGWPALPPVGRPVPRTRVHLLDAELEPVPIGVAGEVYVGGAQLARGYLNRPGTTAERFLPDPFAGRGEPGGRLYKTGDLARLQPAGEIEFLGRVDFQVKVRGFRVELGEIEAALALHEAVRAVAVEAPEIAGLRRLVAYVVAAPGADAAPAELRRFLAERLPVYMIPAHFVPLAALPVAATGKVDRRALPLPDPRSGEDAAYVAPRTPLEEEVAGIWAQVLGANRVGINDSFWDLGGHSLLATKVLSRLHSTLGVELSLQTLFKDPTILGLTAAIGESLLAMEGAESEELLAEPA